MNKFINKFAEVLEESLKHIKVQVSRESLENEYEKYYVSFGEEDSYYADIPIIINGTEIWNIYQLVINYNGEIDYANSSKGTMFFPEVDTLYSPLFDKEELEKIIINKYNLDSNFKII